MELKRIFAGWLVAVLLVAGLSVRVCGVHCQMRTAGPAAQTESSSTPDCCSHTAPESPNRGQVVSCPDLCALDVSMPVKGEAHSQLPKDAALLPVSLFPGSGFIFFHASEVRSFLVGDVGLSTRPKARLRV